FRRAPTRRLGAAQRGLGRGVRRNPVAPLLLAQKRGMAHDWELPPRPLRVHASPVCAGRAEVNRLALLQVDVDEITDVLKASAPREDGCFLLLREGRGSTDRRLLAVDPIFAPEGGWE